MRSIYSVQKISHLDTSLVWPQNVVITQKITGKIIQLFARCNYILLKFKPTTHRKRLKVRNFLKASILCQLWNWSHDVIVVKHISRALSRVLTFPHSVIFQDIICIYTSLRFGWLWYPSFCLVFPLHVGLCKACRGRHFYYESAHQVHKVFNGLSICIRQWEAIHPICWNSSSLSSCSVMVVMALYVRVLITSISCCMGWRVLNCRY